MAWGGKWPVPLRSPKKLQREIRGNTLEDFYSEGKGEGLSFQELENYNLATTYGTVIADEEGVFDTGNSALDG